MTNEKARPAMKENADTGRGHVHGKKQFGTIDLGDGERCSFIDCTTPFDLCCPYVGQPDDPWGDDCDCHYAVQHNDGGK